MIDPITQYMLSEGYVFDDKTIAVNLYEFESGKKNKLLLIGHMGAGKTTWAEFLSKNEAYMVNGRYPARKPRVKWQGIDYLYWTLFKKHFRSKGLKQTDPEVKKELIKLVRKEVIKLLKSNERIILEGVDFIDLYREAPEYRKLILSQPMILIGLSALRAGIRGGIRNMGRGDGEGWRELYWMTQINMKEFESTFKMMRRDAKSLPNAVVEPYKIPSLG